MDTIPTASTQVAPLRRAIKAAGGQVHLAPVLGVTQQALSRALRKGVSPALALRVSAYLGEPVEALFPDLLSTGGK